MSSVRYNICKYFSQSVVHYFFIILTVFPRVEDSTFDEIWVLIFSFMDSAFGVIAKKSLPNFISHMLSSRHCID